jgi:hypothetical protein
VSFFDVAHTWLTDEHADKITQIFAIHLKDYQKTSKRDKDLTVLGRKRKKKGGKTCTIQKKKLSLHPTESTTASLLFGECSVPGWNFFYM